MSEAFLEHINGEHVGELIRLDQNELLIGRLVGCNIVTESRFSSVSQRHAVLRKAQEGWAILDVGTSGKGSTYGTYINDSRLEPNKEVILSPGDEIRLGTRLGKYFRFLGEGTRPVSQPTSLKGRLTVDVSRRQIVVDSRVVPISFTPQEFEFLSLLWQQSGSICPFNEICARLWPKEKVLSDFVDADLRVRINTLAHGLRSKISVALDGLDILESCRGIGYRLKL